MSIAETISPGGSADLLEVRSVRELARPRRLTLIAGVGLSCVAAVAGLAQPLAIGNVVDASSTGVSALMPVLLLAGLFVADAGFTAIGAFFIGRAGESIVLDVRQTVVGRLLRTVVSELQTRRKGDIFTRVITDTSMLKIALSQSLASLTVSSLMVVGGIALMVYIDPFLSMLTLLCLATTAAAAYATAWRLRKASEENRKHIGRLGAELTRALDALPTVKVARAEQAESERIGQYSRNAYRSGLRVATLGALMSPVVSIGLQVAFAVVFSVGMTRVTTGATAAADLTAFLLYLFYLVSPLAALSTAYGQFQQGKAAVNRIDDLLTLPVEHDGEELGHGELPELDRSPAKTVLEFDKVSFGYRPGEAVLNAVSLRVPQTGLTAVVGPSGSGKSTLLHLAVRFAKASFGSIRFRGTDINDIPLEELRGRIGYVEQVPSILHGTIRDNIRYAKPDASDEEVLEAAALADLADMIDDMVRGLDTEVGEQGDNLSGGQRQRVAIARMLLAKPDVLLLDEATSQLDPASELALRETLAHIAADRAVVTVAHRLSTVVDADQIVVLEAGGVRAVGTHTELIENDELYRTMVATQKIQYAEPSGAETGDSP